MSRLEYEKKLKRIKKGKFVKVNDFTKRYGMKNEQSICLKSLSIIKQMG